jgi:hypothetical protein
VRKCPSSILCVQCGSIEEVDHILFSCPVARLVWCVLRDYFGVSSVPKNRDEFVAFFSNKKITKKPRCVVLGSCCCLGTVVYQK